MSISNCEEMILLYDNGFEWSDPLAISLSGPCGTLISECGFPNRITDHIPKSILNGGPILCSKCKMKNSAYLVGGGL